MGDKITKETREQFCIKLLKAINGAEEQFELPEIITGLNKAKCVVSGLVDNLTINNDDSIFKINHTI